MRSLILFSRFVVGLLAFFFIPAAGLGLLVGQYAGPAFGFLGLALAGILFFVGQAWESLAPETRDIVLLGTLILVLQFAGGVLVRQSLIAWTPQGALLQGTIAGAAFALSLIWLPDIRADLALQAPPPPREIQALLFGLDRVLDHTPQAALADVRRLAAAVAKMAEQYL